MSDKYLWVRNTNDRTLYYLVKQVEKTYTKGQNMVKVTSGNPFNKTNFNIIVHEKETADPTVVYLPGGPSISKANPFFRFHFGKEINCFSKITRKELFLERLKGTTVIASSIEAGIIDYEILGLDEIDRAYSQNYKETLSTGNEIHARIGIYEHEKGENWAIAIISPFKKQSWYLNSKDEKITYNDILYLGEIHKDLTKIQFLKETKIIEDTDGLVNIDKVKPMLSEEKLGSIFHYYKTNQLVVISGENKACAE